MEERKTEEKQASVPYFIHEGDMTRMDMAMDKLKKSTSEALSHMRIALIAVCITLVISVLIFSITYTVNNNHWLQYVNELTHVEELTDAEETSELRQL